MSLWSLLRVYYNRGTPGKCGGRLLDVLDIVTVVNGVLDLLAAF